MTELTNWGEYEIPRLEAGWTWRTFTSESNNGCENHDMSWRCLWEMCCSCADLYIIIPTEELHKILRLFPTVTTRYLNFYPSQELIYVCFWFISAQMMHIACKLFCKGKKFVSSIDQIDLNFSITLSLWLHFLEMLQECRVKGFTTLNSCNLVSWSSYIIDKLGFRLSPFPALCTALHATLTADCRAADLGTGDTAGYRGTSVTN